MINETWTYDVTYGPGATGKSTETGNAVIISAKSANPGTYPVSIKFTITFTIKTPDKNSALQFTIRRVPYSGIGSATLNVKSGKFEVRLQPASLHEFSGRSYVKFGVGETGTIVVAKENAADPYTPVFETATSSNSNNFALDNKTGPGYTAGVKNGSSTIKVWAKINGQIEGPESIGISVLQPQKIKFIKIDENIKKNGTALAPNEAGAAFRAMIRVFPSDVSFVDMIIGEEECKPTAPTPTGAFKIFSDLGIADHIPWSYKIPQEFQNPFKSNKKELSNNSKEGCFAGFDRVSWEMPLANANSSGEFIWDIPWIYESGKHKGNIYKIRHQCILTVKAVPSAEYICEVHKNGESSIRSIP